MWYNICVCVGYNKVIKIKDKNNPNPSNMITNLIIIQLAQIIIQSSPVLINHNCPNIHDG